MCFDSQVPEIDSYSPDGKTIENFQGNIRLQGVHFTYPSRPDVKVGRNLLICVYVNNTFMKFDKLRIRIIQNLYM